MRESEMNSSGLVGSVMILAFTIFNWVQLCANSFPSIRSFYASQFRSSLLCIISGEHLDPLIVYAHNLQRLQVDAHKK